MKNYGMLSNLKRINVKLIKGCDLLIKILIWLFSIREVEHLKSSSVAEESAASTNQIQALRNELDEKENIHLGRIKDFEKTIERLEIENSKLKNDQFERPDTEEIGKGKLFSAILFCIPCNTRYTRLVYLVW